MRLGRNDLCPCGSGKKYKRCCGGSAVPASIKEALPVLRQQANEAFRSGDPKLAISLSLQILRAAPQDFDAHHILGLSEFRRGNLREAADHLERAAQIAPHNPFVPNNLSLVYLRLERLELAERCARAALELDPQLADAYNNLGQVLAAKGRSADAVAAYRKAVALSPRTALFHFNLGVGLQADSGDPQEVENCYRRALDLAPDFAPALANLGTLYLQRRQWNEAWSYLVRANLADPGNPQIMTNLGMALFRLKQRDEATRWFRAAIETADYAPAYSNLALVLEATGRRTEAIDLYRQLLAKGSELQQVSANLYRALIQEARYEEAYELLVSTPVARRLSSAEWSAVIGVLQQMADHKRIPEAWPILRQALAQGTLQKGDLYILGLPLCYDDTLEEEEVLRFHTAWGALAAADAQPIMRSHGSGRGDGRLKIGYLSPDFHHHPVGYFIKNVIANHDRSRFEVFCYSNLHRPRDVITETIERTSDHYRDIIKLDDDELAQQIYDDGIDVLIDLAGYTAYSRTEVLARRPAPIQIMYLGYPHSSGAAFVDYWLTDPYAHADDDRMHTERLLRLPESFLCFGSFEERARATLPPAARKGHVTFASFNNLAKLSPTTVGLWARILQRVPRSRLLLKNESLKNSRARANVEAVFQAHGIDRDRLELRGPVADRSEHLDQYARDVDIALDPVPYNGTTTTAEALWMGVPVVTLVGQSHRQRVSYSMLRNIGVEDTIAHDQEQYVAIASDLACDLAALEHLRSRVALAVRQSILCDPVRFTRQLEDVLWRTAETVRAPA